MPEEPINDSPQQPVNNGGADQFNNFNDEAPTQVPNLENAAQTNPEEVSLNYSTPSSVVVSEAPVFESNDPPINDEPNNEQPNSQIVNDFASNPVVEDGTEPASQPFMAPESLPVQSVGSEPMLPPKLEVPSKNKLLIPILIAGILVVILAVAGYFLAKYLF